MDLRGRLDQPIALVKGAVPSDPDLLDWLYKLEGKLPMTMGMQLELRSLVENTRLDIRTLFALGRDFYLATDDSRSATLIYAAAGQRAHSVLQQRGQSGQGLTVVRILDEFRDDYEAALWNRLSRHDDRDAIDTLVTLYTSFLTWCPEDEPDLVRRKPHMRNALAICYSRMDRNDEALALLEQNRTSELNEGERRLRDWNEAVILLDRGHYEEALPGLQACADWHGFQYQGLARSRVIFALEKLGRIDEAKAKLEEYGGD
jgi:tetratricopeptide (TPR) repeat protein